MKKIFKALAIISTLSMGLMPQVVWADSSADSPGLEQRLDNLEQQVADLKQQLQQQKQQSEESAELTMELKQKQTASASKGSLPDWVNSLKITGDFRLRYQYQRRDIVSGGVIIPRNNGKYRSRLQFDVQANKMFKFIFGIATDGGNPRSSNVTFGGNSTANDAFGKANAVINKAYVVFTPAGFLTIKVGKMDNPVWEPTTILWDPDLTPEGGAIELQKKLNDWVTAFSTAGIFVLHDATPTGALRQDPFLFFEQYGVKGTVNKAYYKVAGIYYNVHNPSNIVLTNSLGTNNIIQGYGLRYSFNDVIGGTAEVGLNDPFIDWLPSAIVIPQVGLIGQYTKNTAAAHTGASWTIGGYMGYSALNGWGTWRIFNGYRVIERDAWLDSLTDNDFYSGDTNAAGYRTQLDIGLAKNIWMTFTLLNTHVFKKFNSIITSTSGTTSTMFANRSTETEVQADLNFKF